MVSLKKWAKVDGLWSVFVMIEFFNATAGVPTCIFRYSEPLCHFQELDDNLCSKELQIVNPNDHGLWTQNTDHYKDDCKMTVKLLNNLSLKMGIESIKGYSLFINEIEIQKNIQTLENDFTLHLKKMSNESMYYLKLQYVVYSNWNI